MYINHKLSEVMYLMKRENHLFPPRKKKEDAPTKLMLLHHRKGIRVINEITASCFIYTFFSSYHYNQMHLVDSALILRLTRLLKLIRWNLVRAEVNTTGSRTWVDEWVLRKTHVFFPAHVETMPGVLPSYIHVRRERWLLPLRDVVGVDIAAFSLRLL